MANPLPTGMTWEQLYAMCSSLMRGFTIDPSLFTQVLNDIRTDIESEREYRVLVAQDKSQFWTPGDTWQTPKTMPANFGRWRENNPAQLWDGNPNPGSLVEPINIIPYEDLLWYNSDSYTMAVDYANNQFYFGGNTQQQYIVVLSYVADFGDILQKSGATSYTWQNFPARFHKRLAYETVNSYRLGVSYDELGAANAERNAESASAMQKAMRKWDANLQRVNIRNMDFYPTDFPNFVNRHINMQGN